MSVEIVCVLDRSGSMHNLASDAIGGFNSFLSEQKSFPGDAKLTLVLFNDMYSTIHDRVNIQEVPGLDSRTYIPSGRTALYDALGYSINSIGKHLTDSNESPEKVIFVILTDGEENSSSEFTKEKIAEIIKHQQEKYSWEFIFLAANQDAFATGAGLNISAHNTSNFSASGQGTRSAYATMSSLTSSYRA